MLHEVLLDQLQIVSTAVVAKDWNLVSPLSDTSMLLLGQAFPMRHRELFSHSCPDCCSPVSNVLVEACDQVLWVGVYQIVRVVGEVVGNSHRDWNMLAFVEQIRCGLGEVLRRIIGKCVTKVTKPDVIDASGSLQVCAGHKSGSEAAIHAMRELFEHDNSDAVLLIDASNAFNSLNSPFCPIM